MLRVIEISQGTFNVPPHGYGGSERMSFFLAKALKKFCDVLVIDFRTKLGTIVEYVDRVERHTIGVPLRVGQRLNLTTYFYNAIISAPFLWRHCYQIRHGKEIDLLHFHHGAQFVIYWLINLFTPKDRSFLVYTLHSPRWMEPKRLSLLEKIVGHLTELIAVKKADLVTFESEVIAESILSLVHVPFRKTLVMYNGVDTDEFNPSKYVDVPDRFSILYAAKIHEQKNQILVVKAFSHVVSKESKAKLILVGDIEDEDYYKNLVRQIENLGLRYNVVLQRGVSIETLNRIRARCGIHLVFSKFAGFDVAVGETLSFGRAPILSDIPPVRGIARNMENCILVGPNDEIGLSNAMLHLIEEPVFTEQISTNARLTALQKLDWRVLARTFLRKVERLLRDSNRCTYSVR